MGKTVAAVAVMVIVAGCGAGGPGSPPRPTRAQTISASPSTSGCIAKRGYGGLGASKDLFDANNNGSTGPAEPTPGAAWYQVIGVGRGCVTGYAVQDSAAPPLTPQDMLDLVSPYLPRDAKQLVDTGTCAVWKSPSLRRAVGLLYAKATAIAQIGSLGAGSARMQATSVSSC